MPKISLCPLDGEVFDGLFSATMFLQRATLLAACIRYPQRFICNKVAGSKVNRMSWDCELSLLQHNINFISRNVLSKDSKI